MDYGLCRLDAFALSALRLVWALTKSTTIYISHMMADSVKRYFLKRSCSAIVAGALSASSIGADRLVDRSVSLWKNSDVLDVGVIVGGDSSVGDLVDESGYDCMPLPTGEIIDDLST